MGGTAASMQLSWFRLWVTRQLLQGVMEHDELPYREAVCGSSAKNFLTVS